MKHTGQTASSAFRPQLRNEVTQFKSALRKLPKDNSQSNRAKRREVFKSLVAHITLGIDMSSVFQDVILNSVTSDITQKKLINVYLNFYAKENSDLALLLVNSYTKETMSQDATVRALAIRALSNLGETVEEYAIPCIIKALYDPSAYVQKIAISALLNLSNSKDYARELRKLVDTSNINKGVQICAFLAIHRIDNEYRVSQKHIASLFNNIKNASWFEKVISITMMNTLTPSDEEILLGLLDSLEDFLKCTNSSIVLVTAFAMLCLIRNYSAVNNKDWTKESISMATIQMVMNTILTLSRTESFETQFVLLEFLKKLISIPPSREFSDLLVRDWELFIPHFVDLSEITVMKMDILIDLIREDNCTDIITCVKSSLVLTHQNSFIMRKYGELLMEYLRYQPESVMNEISHIKELIAYDIHKHTGVLLEMLVNINREFGILNTDGIILDKITVKELNEPGKQALLALIIFDLEFGSRYLKEIITNIFSVSGNKMNERTTIYALFCLVISLSQAPQLSQFVSSIFTSFTSSIDEQSVGVVEVYLALCRAIQTDSLSELKVLFCAQHKNIRKVKEVYFNDLLYLRFHKDGAQFCPLSESYDIDFMATKGHICSRSNDMGENMHPSVIQSREVDLWEDDKLFEDIESQGIIQIASDIEPSYQHLRENPDYEPSPSETISIEDHNTNSFVAPIESL